MPELDRIFGMIAAVITNFRYSSARFMSPPCMNYVQVWNAEGASSKENGQFFFVVVHSCSWLACVRLSVCLIIICCVVLNSHNVGFDYCD